jgi:RNA polymerase sigma factor (sigma-70 family)
MAYSLKKGTKGNRDPGNPVRSGRDANIQTDYHNNQISARMNHTQVSDDIIEGCRKGKRSSQKELYELFYAYGMSITLRYADTREQAAGVLNDAFMKVFEHIRKYDRNRPFKPWFRQILVNTAINHYHRNNRNRDDPNMAISQQNLAVEETITSSISYEEIIGMVQQLSPAYRTVFNLYVIEGFTHEEIAGMLGISAGTSKSNLAKAKRNLRAILEKNLT